MPGRFLSKETQRKMRQRQRRQRIAVSAVSQWTLGLVIVAVILLNLFTHVLQIARYNGAGMEPNLSSGQTLVIHKTQEVSEGDIIAFFYNNQVLVRRVVCMGGKQLSIEEDGTLLVNSQEVREDYLAKKSIGQCNIDFPYHVRSGYVFVLGDNREIAMDSRLKEIGPVPQDRIIGKVLFAI